MSIPCSELAPLSAARRLGILEPEDGAELDAHIASCARCRELEEKLDAAFEGGALVRRTAPDGLREKIASRIAEERRERRDPAGVLIVLACTYCHDSLDREGAVFCASCLAPAHKECFVEHGRCSAPGCEETRFVKATTASASGTADAAAGNRKRSRWPVIALATGFVFATAAAAGLVHTAFQERRMTALEAELTEERLAASQKEEEGAKRQRELEAQLAEARRAAEARPSRRSKAADEERLREIAREAAAEAAFANLGSIEGTILAHGKPLPNATIEVEILGKVVQQQNGAGREPSKRRSFKTDAQGHYLLRGLDPDLQDILFSTNLSRRVGAFLPDPELQPGTPWHYDVDMAPGSVLVGQLKLPSGASPRDLRLRVIPLIGKRSLGTIKAHEAQRFMFEEGVVLKDGTYRFETLLPPEGAESFLLEATLRGNAGAPTVAFAELPSISGTATDVKEGPALDLTAGHLLRGRVLRGGQPANRTIVRAFPAGVLEPRWADEAILRMSSEWELQTGSDGTFAIRVAPGNFDVFTDLERAGPFTVGGDGDVDLGDLEVEKKPAK